MFLTLTTLVDSYYHKVFRLVNSESYNYGVNLEFDKINFDIFRFIFKSIQVTKCCKG